MRKFKQICTNIIKQLNIQISVGRYFLSKRQYIQWIPGWTWCCRQWSMQRLDPKQYHWRSLDMPSFQSEHRVQYQLSSHQSAVRREMNHVISKQNFTKIYKCLKLSEIRWTVSEGYRMVPQKKGGLGKCWPDLEISTAFVTGLKVLFSCDFMSQGLKFILRLVKLIKCLKL